MRSLVLASVFVVCGSGCASVQQTRPYRPQTMTVAAVKPALYTAIENLVHNQGWQLVVTEPSQGFVEAVGPIEVTLGMGMRERWHFDIRDYEVEVIRYLEVQFDRDGGEWMRESAVSRGYGYQREQEVLASLGTKFGVAIQ
jgi:hypothetical protein